MLSFNFIYAHVFKNLPSFPIISSKAWSLSILLDEDAALLFCPISKFCNEIHKHHWCYSWMVRVVRGRETKGERQACVPADERMAIVVAPTSWRSITAIARKKTTTSYLHKSLVCAPYLRSRWPVLVSPPLAIASWFLTRSYVLTDNDYLTATHPWCTSPAPRNSFDN